MGSSSGGAPERDAVVVPTTARLPEARAVPGHAACPARSFPPGPARLHSPRATTRVAQGACPGAGFSCVVQRSGRSLQQRLDRRQISPRSCPCAPWILGIPRSPPLPRRLARDDRFFGEPLTAFRGKGYSGAPWILEIPPPLAHSARSRDRCRRRCRGGSLRMTPSAASASLSAFCEADAPGVKRWALVSARAEFEVAPNGRHSERAAPRARRGRNPVAQGARWRAGPRAPAEDVSGARRSRDGISRKTTTCAPS